MAELWRLAALLIIPLGFALGVFTVVTAVLAALILAIFSLALGATGTLWEWILVALAAGLSTRVWEPRQLLRRLRTALATLGPGTGRPRLG